MNQKCTWRYFIASKKIIGKACTKAIKEKVVTYYLSAVAVSFRD